jgi:rSAM/selenodomain-associated transferase 1
MIAHTVRAAGEFGASSPVCLQLWYDGDCRAALSALCGPAVDLRRQSKGSLGQRMGHALTTAFREGAERAILIGTDCPRLSSVVLRKAHRALDSSRMVVGPAADGGYYLLALRREAAEPAVQHLFDGVPWGTAEVLATTLRAARLHGLQYSLLDTLVDVDRPEDLSEWENATGEEPAPRDGYQYR